MTQSNLGEILAAPLWSDESRPAKNFVTFTINDIDLNIAPEAISVQKEDLVYSWRTLRSNSSTKIPSGHGQMLCQVKIPFMDGDILSLHRLIVQIRNSPFVYVENTWLRHDMCPEWELDQKMAFTVTALDVVPYPGTTNAWMVNLEMVWFNYFPYVHNYLFRREWCTNWITNTASNLQEGFFYKNTIGWDIDKEGNRKGFRVNPIAWKATLTDEDVNHQEWSALNNSYNGKDLTIEDMELLHRGGAFDLQPLPGNMEASDPVPSPSESLIYKRYINFLQRDALVKHFGINPEEEIGNQYEEDRQLHDLLFGSFQIDPADKMSFYVHSMNVESLPPVIRQKYPLVQKAWSRLFNKLVSHVLSHKESTKPFTMAFASYKAAKLPNEASQALPKYVKQAKKPGPPTGSSDESSKHWIWNDEAKRQIQYRYGLTNPAGFHTPLSKEGKESKAAASPDQVSDFVGPPRGGFTGPESATKRSFQELVDKWPREKGRLCYREAGVLQKAYKDTTRTSGRFHWGTDFGNIGTGVTKVYAVKEGIVKYVNRGQTRKDSKFSSWRVVDLDLISTSPDKAIYRLSQALSKYQDDWATLLPKLKDLQQLDPGTFIRSIKYPSIFYYVDMPDGGYHIEINHGEHERSKYMHLIAISPELSAGKQVHAGDFIAYAGNSGPYSKDSVLAKLNERAKYYAAGGIGDLDSMSVDYELSPHLHFEYWERLDWKPRETSPEKDYKIDEPQYDKGWIPVDLKPTFEWASGQGYSYQIPVDVPIDNTITLKEVEGIVEQATDLSDENKSSLIDALNTLYKEGYYYYDKQEDVINTWWKPWIIELAISKPEEEAYDALIQEDTAILTSCSGGLRHIVANIPILGQEFPTQQHLGSIEPYYNFEFHILDDSPNLEGLGSRGGLLSGIRQLLQHNARKFRPIPDAWCMVVDCFLTRLLGSFNESDFKVSTDGDFIRDFTMNRRAMISRATNETVQGNPGLSRMMWEVQETNPYFTDKLSVEADTQESVDENRAKILQALWGLKFAERYRGDILKILVAQSTGSFVVDQESSEYGKFKFESLSKLGTSYKIYENDPTLIGLFSRTDTLAKASDHPQVYVAEVDQSNELVRRFMAENNIPFAEWTNESGEKLFGISERDLGLVPYKDTSKSTYITGGTYYDINRANYDMRNANNAYYDISKVLQASQANTLLAEIPMDKIMLLLQTLKDIVESAEMYMAEDPSWLVEGYIEGTNVPVDVIRKEMYGLPVEPRLFRTYQQFLLNTANATWYPSLAKDGIGLGSINTWSKNIGNPNTDFEKNPNWLIWAENHQLNNITTSSATTSYWEKFWYGMNFITPGVSVVTNTLSEIPFRIYSGWTNAQRSAEKGALAFTPYASAQVNECAHKVANDIAANYVNGLPMSVLATSETVKSTLEDSFFGSLFSYIVDAGGDPSIAATRTRLEETAFSCGNFHASPWSRDWVFWVPNVDPTTIKKYKDKGVDVNPNSLDIESYDDGITSTLPSYNNTERDFSDQQWDSTYNVTSKMARVFANATDMIGWGQWFDGLLDLFYSDLDWIIEAGLPMPGSAFKWSTELAIEREKLKYFRRLLSQLADICLDDPEVLRAFGLEGLLSRRIGFPKGREAYPDLELPYHPYYGDTYSVYPDFYMWNMYEDGDAFNSDAVAAVKTSMYHVLENCYNSMKRMDSTESGNGPKRNKVVIDPETQAVAELNSVFRPEGKDSGEYGPTSFESYPNSEASSGINKFFSDIGNEDIKNPNPKGIRYENGANFHNAGAGLQYPSRISETLAEKYKQDFETFRQRTDELKQIKSMFGSRYGYLGKKDVPSSVEDRLNGTPLERDLQPTHAFDLGALKKLAEQSSVDIFSEKRRMARAYPTFKLYFVEEDEAASRLLNYDDFHSYNAIKDMSVVISRKHPGDVATVTLQNISGVLDGTKRDAVVDLDYWSNSPKLKDKVYGDNPVTNGTVDDQPFGALVLRPGLNVQLRVGYSNDPDNLNVMINGRVVDVQWNQQGDLAQIMIQGFGVELAQVLKGTQYGVEETHYTTHQLLGSLMMEPEVVHFGRWEIGKLYQYGEAQDYTLDFYDYSKESYLGRFGISRSVMNFMYNHPFMLLFVAAGGVGVLSLGKYSGRLFRNVSRWGMSGNWWQKAISKVATKAGVVGRIEDDFNDIVLKEAATLLVKNADDVVTAETKLTATLAKQILGGLYADGDAVRLFGRLKELVPEGAARKVLLDEIKVADKKFFEKFATEELTVGDLAEHLAQAEGIAAMRIFKGRWFSNPASTATGWEMIKDIGMKPLSNVLTASTSTTGKIVAGAAAGAAGLDTLNYFLGQSIYDYTLGAAERYFAASKASLKLSPQDDNLFPPHPKDYMVKDVGWSGQLLQWIVHTGLSATLDDSLGQIVNRYLFTNDPFDKRVTVDACKYTIRNSYIWDIFHEMSLRHPGWIYAIRPYGKEFRYTMFFGVPSQRYWSMGASNDFIDRMNRIFKRISKDQFTLQDYRALYGDYIGGQELNEFDTNLLNEQGAINFVENADANEERKQVIRDTVYKSRAIGEYLRGLTQRFVPFRKYHMLSSETDIVWNGIMGSENASYNAVDVTYMSETEDLDPDSGGVSPEASALVKAHAFLPESMLRVQPLPLFTNCKGYNMAMRYGMGALSHSLRDMYRGEIVVLGNPRIMPWDICILHDTYNSMVGPVEVEQVVHNFSHETGYITEIKPSALVLTNETSSWPVLEAMKLASLAVQNIEEDKLGMSSGPTGILGKVDYWVNHGGIIGAPGTGTPEYEDYAKRKMKEIFGDKWDDKKLKFVDGQNLVTLTMDNDGDPRTNLSPDERALDKLNETMQTGLNLASSTAMAGGLATGLAAASGVGLAAAGGFLGKKWPVLGSKAVRGVSLVGGLLNAPVSAGLLTASYVIDPPQLMSLLGGSLLMLQCLRGDSIMLVPLMKNGYPIVSGLNYHDPNMIWRNFLGDLGRFADDVIGGGQELADLWQIYGTYAWRRLPGLGSYQLDANRQLQGVEETGVLK